MLRAETPATQKVNYVGVRKTGTDDLMEIVVERPGKDPYRLDWRLDLVNHSPTGIGWGYPGSGAAQCAAAILADYFSCGENPKYQRRKDFEEYDPTNPNERAKRLYMDFKWAYISQLKMEEGFELNGAALTQIIIKLEEAQNENSSQRSSGSAGTVTG